MDQNQHTPVRELPGAVTFTKTISEFDVYSFTEITATSTPYTSTPNTRRSNRSANASPTACC